MMRVARDVEEELLGEDDEVGHAGLRGKEVVRDGSNMVGIIWV